MTDRFYAWAVRNDCNGIFNESIRGYERDVKKIVGDYPEGEICLVEVLEVPVAVESAALYERRRYEDQCGFNDHTDQ